MSKNRLLPNLEDTDAENEWTGMPEFIQKNQPPYQEIIIRFCCEEDVQKFARKVKQNITKKTTYLWFPKRIRKEAAHDATGKYRKYIDES